MKYDDFKKNGNMLIGACGAISVTHICSWVMYFRMSFCENVQVILTKQASKMINPWSVTQYTNCPTFTDLIVEDNQQVLIPHVSLAKKSDLLLILPATANMIGKVANGIADDLVSTTILNAKCLTVFVPFMNMEMWEKKSVQRNISRLKEDGYHVFYNIQEFYKISSGSHAAGIGINLDKLVIKLKRLIK